ncbi:MAG: hypothetical protein ACRCW9_09975 [Cetobacterium sp.]
MKTKIKNNNNWMYEHYSDPRNLKYWTENIKNLLKTNSTKEYIMDLYDLKKGEPMYIFTLGLIQYIKEEN